MKRFLFTVLFAILGLVCVNAQDYSEYLSIARRHLAEGNIEKASKAYSTYCELTKSRDYTFEKQVEEYNLKSWEASCYIIEVNDSTKIAIQKLPNHQEKVTYYTALSSAKASRTGGYFDWRLPTINELHVIIQNIPSNELYYEKYFCDVSSLVEYTKKHTELLNKAEKITNRKKAKYTPVIQQVIATIDNTNEYHNVYFQYLTESGSILETGNKNVLANYFIVRTVQ